MLDEYFEPSLQALHHQLESGRIGTVHLIKIHRRLAHGEIQAIDSNRNFFGFFAHDVMLLQYLSPSTIEELSVQHDSLTDDVLFSASLSLNLSDGSLALLTATLGDALTAGRSVEVFGSKGMLQTEQQSEDGVFFLESNGICSSRLWSEDRTQDRLPTEFNVARLCQLLENQAATTTGSAAMHALKVLEMAHLSFATGTNVKAMS